MPTISTTYTASPALQQGYQQLKLQQAQRNAEQAESTARTLREQAANAQARADQAQEAAREIAVRSDQAQNSAGSARAGLEALRSLSDTSARLQDTYTRISEAINGQNTSETNTAPAVATETQAPAAITPTINATEAYLIAGSTTPNTGMTIDTTA